jgi:hypothetical protein
LDDHEALRADLCDMSAFIAAGQSTDLLDPRQAARLLDGIAEWIFDCLGVQAVDQELAALIQVLPDFLDDLSQQQLPEQDLSDSILRFWDLALGHLSGTERGLSEPVLKGLRQALLLQEQSSADLLRESARVGATLLGITHTMSE